MLVSPYKLCMLFAIQEKIQLRDRSDVVRLSNVSCSLTVHSAEYHMFVFIASCCVFENRLESHAWPARLRPKVYNYSLIVFNQFRQMSLI